MPIPQAVLWDVDGTLAETERDGHRVAFNRAFEAYGLPWRWDEARYGELLHVTGGRERLLYDMHRRANAPAEDEREAIARAVHAKKNALYAELLHTVGIPLRQGVLPLMRQCHARGVRMGIATTTSRANVEALLGMHLGARWADQFAVVVCGEDVQQKKPHPEVYLQALRALALDGAQAVAIEDAPAGVAAARAAGISVVVARSVYFAQASIEGAVAIGASLHDRCGWQPAPQQRTSDAYGIDLDDIGRWCAQSTTASALG